MLAFCAVVALSACSSSSGDDNAKSTPSTTSAAAETQTSTPKSKSPDETAGDELLAAYNGYLDEIIKSYSQADVGGTHVKRFATGAALVTVQSQTKAMAEAGQVTTGRPASTPKVTMIDLKRQVPRATITDCMDVSQWKVVDRTTKKEVELPKERLTKYIDVISLEKWGRQWIVLKETPQERKC
ncbi:hypothetical protein [Streptomyces sp. NPDC086182]|jgi:hypothetical protein|uniref:hypothetical protein n=1 Tax=Streptomyces sp. NPDC086182 TaxID=3155058 RepID=UPI00342DE343